MKHRNLLWPTLATLALLSSACGSSGGGGQASAAASAAAPSAAASPAAGGAYTPPKLDGKQLVFSSLGGAYQKAEDTAMIEPFMKATGATVTDLEGWDEAKLTASVKAGKPIADVLDMDTVVSAAHCGTDLMEIDKSVVTSMAKVDQSMVASACGAPIIRYGFGIFYNTKKYSPAPAGCKDFFDTAKFPGTRGVMGSAIPNQILECALVADGVAADKLYPMDLDRAFAKIASIKDSIKFWGSGAESQDLMTSGEVDMLMAWTGRGYNAIVSQKAPYALVPADIFVLSDDLVVPKGVADPATSMQLVEFMLQPQYQVELAKLIPYSPSRTDAQIDTAAATAPYLVSNPSFKTIPVDQKWWAENVKAVQTAWDKNITQ